MRERVEITIQIPRATWETIQRYTLELQGLARDQGAADALFDPYLHAAMILEQAVDIEESHRKRRLRAS
jgi:hypothetical protein